jgi:hypothetical protein
MGLCFSLEKKMPTPFQAEYEGSIPFTRSNVFKHCRRFAMRWR